MKYIALIAAMMALSPWTIPMSFAQSPPLTVALDKGGTSALPYSKALTPPFEPVLRQGETPRPPAKTFSEADMLPVRSTRLSPGVVTPRVLDAPGLMPFFLIGDDNFSRNWLRERESILRELKAVGLVVNVTSIEALNRLRELMPGLPLAPVSGDDLAERLALRHYPVLITATGIEQ